MPRRHGQYAAVAITAVAAVTMLAHAGIYERFVYDDAYISLRYARRLLEGHGLTWTDGPAVEGYSNLLFTLLCAALAKLGVPWRATLSVVGSTGALLAVGAVVYAHAPRRWTDALPATMAAAFVALAGPIAIWAVAGLEASLVAGLLAWGVALLRQEVGAETPTPRRAWQAGVVLSLLVLARADAFVLAGACALGVLDQRARREGGFRAAVPWTARVACLPALTTAAHFLLRYGYYGEWVPNSARAKVAFGTARILGGAQCVEGAAVAWLPLCLLAGAALLVTRGTGRAGPIVGLTATPVVVGLFYATFVVCEEFGYRSLTPLLPLLAMLGGDAVAWAHRRWRRPALSSGIGLGALLAFVACQERDSNITWARRPRAAAITEKGRAIGHFLREAFGARRPLLAVNGAGAIPFASELPALDTLGLTDATIAKRRPPGMGHGMIGHELGDASYVLERAPDILIEGITGTARLAHRVGNDLRNNPAFARGYLRVRFLATSPMTHPFYAWIRREGRLGLRRDGCTIEVPTYLLARETPARLLDGRPVVPLTSPLSYRPLDLAPDRWTAAATAPDGSRLTARLARLDEGRGASLTVEGPSTQAVRHVQLVRHPCP